jgi:hypothetical protein
MSTVLFAGAPTHLILAVWSRCRLLHSCSHPHGRGENSPVFSTMVNCAAYELESDTLTLIPGTATRGAMAKCVVVVTPSTSAFASGPRRFLWTLQQERRPPRAGEWLLYEVIAIDNAIMQTL